MSARVYVSSSALDLRDERKAVIDVVRNIGYKPLGMEFYSADTRPPLEKCLRDVGLCDVYVGIVAWRYGSCPPGERKSFTQLEYEKALNLDKKILVFHHDKKASRPFSHVDRFQWKVEKFRRMQSKAHTLDHFSTLEQLSTCVRRALLDIYPKAGASVPELLPFSVDRHVHEGQVR